MKIVNILLLSATFLSAHAVSITRFPANNARNINPDTHLVLTFPEQPVLGTSGKICIYDASDNRLVDMLDLSIPPGKTVGTKGPASPDSPVPYEYKSGHFTNVNTKPGTPSGVALPTTTEYQLTIIGGFTDGFHFFPVIIHGNTATIYPHNNLLEYNKTYYVEIDPTVFALTNGGFSGIKGKNGWPFTTKKTPPPINAAQLVVSADGKGDFNTVQGALDFIPDKNPKRVTVFVKKGKYEEIVYFRNKSNITILGEDKEKTVVFYPNNEVLNPHPSNVGTNELPGTFPSRRAAFSGDNCQGIHLVNLTIKTTVKGQAEGLLLTGDKNIVDNVIIVGSGDALQVNGTAYFINSQIIGDGDTVLGRGAAFFDHCRFDSQSIFMWIRNTSANHGNVCVNCIFNATGKQETEIARAPNNRGKSYPNAEAVLINCALSGVSPIGWGTIGDSTNIHYWEYNSTRLSDGKPIDVSKRRPASRQLTMEKDADIITHYSNPAYVLNGWIPAMKPIILSQPASTVAKTGENVTFGAKATAVPEAKYQWFKNGKIIACATNATLILKNISLHDAASYTVTAKNSSGSAISKAATLNIK